METSLGRCNPVIMSGRVPVQNLFCYLKGSSSLDDFSNDFPSIRREKAIAVLQAAMERPYADAPAA